MTTYPRAPSDIDHLSHSAISTYLRCPRQFAYSYLEGLRRPPGIALLKGSAVDKAASHNLAQKIDSHSDLPSREVQEVAEDALRQDVDANGGAGEVDWGGKSYPVAIDSVVALTERHMLSHAPLIQPAAVQLELERPIPGTGRTLLGYLDYVTETGIVGDVKTGSRKMGRDDADNDGQPTAYAWLLGRPIQFEFVRVIDTGRYISDEIVTTSRGATDTAWFERQAQEVSGAIDAAAFPPNTQGWHCSPRFCGYWIRCRVSNSPPVIG